MATRSKAVVGAVRADCPRCARPTLRQLVGRRAALDVTADAAPLELERALALAGPNRLAWCLVSLRGAGVDLRWLHTAGAACAHRPVLDHQCPTGTPAGLRPAGALW